MLKYKHSVLIICFNQEQYIKKTLDSILDENDKPFEIIIGDDASEDSTPQILIEYKKRFPEIIKLVLRDKNIGIFRNQADIVSRASGEIISFVGGDDWYLPGALKKIDLAVQENALDPNKDKFLCLPNVLFSYPDGTEILKKNPKSLIDSFSPFSLALRDKITSTYQGISRSLFNDWPKFHVDSDNIGLWTDRIHYLEFTQYIDTLLPIDETCAAYRVGVGISSKVGEKELARSYVSACDEIFKMVDMKKINMSAMDLDYLKVLRNYNLLFNNFSLGLFIDFILLSLKVSLNDRLARKLVLKNFMLLVRAKTYRKWFFNNAE